VAAYCKQSDVRVVQIRHSGKRRAEETAHILGEHLSPAEDVVRVEGISPNDDVVPIVEELKQLDQPVMLVSHLPFLDRLLEELVTGNPNAEPTAFQVGALVALARENGEWTIRWFISPDKIP
jgi:phosphohistidine phosphatase